MGTMSNMDKQIRELPYPVFRKLAQVLDPPGPMNWKSLIAQMPEGTYTNYQVSYFEMAGDKRGGSSTEALLTDMGQKLKTVRQLVAYLKQLEHLDALEIIGVPLEPVEITEQPQSQPVQEGQRVVLRCRANGLPAPQYQWVKNGAEIPRGVDNELVIDPVKLTDRGDYYCIVSNRKSSEKTNHVEIQVHPAPGAVDGCDSKPPTSQATTAPPRITRQPASALVPVGKPCRLMCQATGHPQYQWYKDGFKLYAAVEGALLFQPFEYRHEGNYTCKVYNGLGDELSRIATLQAAPHPSPDQQTSESVRPMALRQTATDKIALIIGNKTYFKLPPGESQLVHTASDSQTLASILRKPEMGFKVLSFENLNKEEMEKAVDMFCSLLNVGVYGLVYFAGHGFQEGGQNYLVPVDADPEWTPEEAVCVQKILQKMHERRPQLNVFLLDVCRKRAQPSSEFRLELYDFPHEAQVVMGYATCPQSEAYERRSDPNGLYMKHLIKHILSDEKIEDILHRVSGDVDDEVRRDQYTTRQRPQYDSRTSRAYSLRDPIIPCDDPDRHKRNQLWYTVHKLPEKYVEEFEDGPKVEIRFEHSTFSSNVIVLCLRIVELGPETTMCDANLLLDNMPLHLSESHFHPTTTNLLRQIIPSQREETLARSWPREGTGNPPADQRPLPVERITFIRNVQRLNSNLSLTIGVRYKAKGTDLHFFKIKAFNLKEFGIAMAFA